MFRYVPSLYRMNSEYSCISATFLRAEISQLAEHPFGSTPNNTRLEHTLISFHQPIHMHSFCLARRGSMSRMEAWYIATEMIHLCRIAHMTKWHLTFCYWPSTT